MPEGKRWNLYFLPLTTMVCPALDPPATRAQTSYSCKKVGAQIVGREREREGSDEGGEEEEEVMGTCVSEWDEHAMVYAHSLSLSLPPL